VFREKFTSLFVSEVETHTLSLAAKTDHESKSLSNKKTSQIYKLVTVV